MTSRGIDHRINLYDRRSAGVFCIEIAAVYRERKMLQLRTPNPVSHFCRYKKNPCNFSINAKKIWGTWEKNPKTHERGRIAQVMQELPLMRGEHEVRTE